MKKLLFVLFAVLSVNAYAQDWKDELAKDLVEIKAEKMTATDLTLITMLADGTSMQVKAYAEAPANSFISRDQFVAIFSTLTITLIENMLSEAGLTESDYKTKTVEIEDLIGTADVELSCYMGKNGIQIVIKAGGEENKVTQTWESMFE
ncbi:hypothetical protein [Maribellus sp. YY47]|uniref:hypothetical protein n=1 Tax=Maribellus sp. YY47 TaxID=2929486 RepID=UPI0020018D8B|nr:hypothetical protein [Maribellus sp. YY47]MCK3684284.1 hypothetical protein [Maribellus sp. YY47]